ncbi:hypothetical protein [Entomobacter blattae]|uniref:Uncharacterized protein n=1 Tax=Entomobacter blattae TaxID=2762277 RepID=A0A7H1NNP2_9PROT|nr:hypothetical protein [Entomobacter blattae]QNT77402.1 hypothetical protein JGUZn3_01360 [Entomobacter blattae]
MARVAGCGGVSLIVGVAITDLLPDDNSADNAHNTSPPIALSQPMSC